MDHLVRMLLFDNVLINATSSSESGATDLRHVTRIESLLIKAASATGDASVKVEYAISPDDVSYGSYDDEADILDDNENFTANVEGWHAVTMPNIVAQYAKLKVTGLADNPTDTRVTAYLLVRETIN